ncbi:aminotransferase A [Aureibacillus halotolerans]|nr:aminotransferase A [Aureibacillus halotolerans]
MLNDLNEAVREIQISGIRRFFNLVAGFPDAVQLTLGQPDFPTPDAAKAAAVKAIEENQTTYTANAGMLSLRKAVSETMQSYGLCYDQNTEIIVTTGASQAIDVALRTILQPGDEVILPAPVYPGYEPIIRLCGATPVFIDTRDSDFLLTVDQLEAHFTETTKAVILPYPSNPTGRILSKDDVEKIAAFLHDKNVFVLADEIYAALCFQNNHVSIASEPRMKEKTIVVQGVSKSHSMTGWRIGFLLAPEPLAKQMLKVHQYNVACASSISQHAALAALTEAAGAPDQMRSVYQQRADYVCQRLTAMDLDFVQPEGGFYVFVGIQKFGLKSEDFALQLLEKENLALIPGDAFSTYGEGYVRLSFAYSMEALASGLDRLEAFVTHFASLDR